MFNSRKYLAGLVICFLLTVHTTGILAQESRNGYWIPPRDTIRIFLIYAEMAGDPDDPRNIRGWKKGTVPPDPGFLFDHDLGMGQKPSGIITKYFYQASFGEYIVLADYYPEIVSLDFNRVRGRGFNQVLDRVISDTADDILTAHGYSVNNGDFDFITPSTHGMPKKSEPDGMIDMVMVIWRVNSKMTRDLSAGFCAPYARKLAFKEMAGMNSHSSFVMKDYTHYAIIRHEFSHLLLGGNNFHTGGAGAGVKTFMSSAGGYAMLSSYDKSSPVYCSFDRRRLGWKHPDNEFQISARDSNGREINADLVYGQDFIQGEGQFILRDFVETGDAIRIELPYLRRDSDDIKRQWLWLENHQLSEGNLDHERNSSAGLYAYIQVGKETLEGKGTYGGQCNYTWPVSAFGNYDMYIDEETLETSVNDRLSNPFTGYNNLIRGAYDLKDKDERITRDELFTAKNLKINGKYADSSIFNYLTYPIFGTSMDAFQPGDRIGIDRNPAAVPVMTYTTTSSRHPRSPAPSDNRLIHLNGLSVEFMEQLQDGSIRLGIKWNDTRLGNNVRWCGNIHLHEELDMDRRVRMLLDVGLTPQRPMDPDILGGHVVFNDPSSLTLHEGTKLNMGKKSRIVLDNGSSLNLDRGSSISMERGSRIIVRQSCRLLIHPEAEISGRGKIIMRGSSFAEFDESKLGVRLKSPR
jgi:hypothetical protein